MSNVIEFKPRDSNKKQPLNVSTHEICLLQCPDCGSTRFKVGKFDGLTEIQCGDCDLLATQETIDWLLDGVEDI